MKTRCCQTSKNMSWSIYLHIIKHLCIISLRKIIEQNQPWMGINLKLKINITYMLKQCCTLKKRVYVNRICGLPMSISTTRQQINRWWVYNCPYLANPLLFCKGQLKPGRLCIYRILWYHMVSYILLYLIQPLLIFFVSFLYCNLILSLFIDSNLVYLCLSSLIYQEMYSCIDLSIYKPIHLPTYTSTSRRITMSPLKAMM